MAKYVCPFCIEEEGDELHFLSQCPVYDDLRIKYLHPFDRRNKVSVYIYIYIYIYISRIPEERKMYIRQKSAIIMLLFIHCLIKCLYVLYL